MKALKKSINFDEEEQTEMRDKLITFYVGCLRLADKDILGEKYGYLKIAIIIFSIVFLRQVHFHTWIIQTMAKDKWYNPFNVRK